MKKISYITTLILCLLLLTACGKGVRSLSFATKMISVEAGETKALELIVEPAGAQNYEIVWVSGNTDIVDVDQSGRMTAVKKGDTLITAKTKDGRHTVTLAVTVLPKSVKELRLDQETLLLTTGSIQQLATVINPDDAENPAFEWTTDDSAVAYVDSNGLVQAISPGTTVVRAVTKDGRLSAGCSITVKDIPVTGVKLNTGSITPTLGATVVLRADVFPQDAHNKKVSWTSSNTKVAAVDANGAVKAISAGTAEITVKTQDGGHTDKAIVNIAPAGIKPRTETETPQKSETAKISFGVKAMYYYDNSVELYVSNSKELALPFRAELHTREGSTPFTGTTQNQYKIKLPTGHTFIWKFLPHDQYQIIPVDVYVTYNGKEYKLQTEAEVRF